MQLSTFTFRPAKALPFIGRIFLALSIVVFSTSTSYADIVVQNTEKVPSLNAGRKVPDNYAFDLPKDGRVSLLKTPSGETFEINGPFKGTLQKFIANCNSWMWFRYAYCRSGSGDQLPVGGTRGIQTEPKDQ